MANIGKNLARFFAQYSQIINKQASQIFPTIQIESVCKISELRGGYRNNRPGFFAPRILYRKFVKCMQIRIKILSNGVNLEDNK